MKIDQWRRALAVLAFFAPVVANGATVQGQLVNASGKPSAYVAVRLTSNGKGPSEFAYSGGDGRFYLKNVPAGDYQLEVWQGSKVVTSLPVRVQEPTTTLPPILLPESGGNKSTFMSIRSKSPMT
jgi:hypothetical protein